ncbi:MAG: glycosyltransferase family 87 protein [Pseudomonadota bacterium]
MARLDEAPNPQAGQQQMTATQRYLWIAWVNALTMAVIFATFIHIGIDFPETVTCVTRFVDFHAIWGAARIALDGNITDAFQRETLEQAYSACDQVNMYWLYPAPMVPLVTPFGLMPFLLAFLTFAALSVLVLMLSLRPLLPNDKVALVAFLFAPAWLPALLIGQFTVLWCAGLLAAITAMRADRHLLAGFLFGLLTVKPTLGLLIPVVLLADRRYRTIAAAVLTTLVLHTSSTAFYGLDYFRTWIIASRDHGASLAENLAILDVMGSVAAFAAQFGAPSNVALSVNLGVMIVVAIVLFLVWRQAGAKSDAACAALCAALPLSTPYLWHYDAAFSALSALFIYRIGPQKRHPAFWIILAILWIGPGFRVLNAYTFQLPWLIPPLIDPFVLFLALAISIQQLGMGSDDGQHDERVA